jgi:hypothetical protein
VDESELLLARRPKGPISVDDATDMLLNAYSKAQGVSFMEEVEQIIVDPLVQRRDAEDPALTRRALLLSLKPPIFTAIVFVVSVLFILVYLYWRH